MQILPAIDIRGGQCVRLRQGDYAQETVFGDDPVEMAKRWVDQGAERLHLVDLDGAKAGQPVNLKVIEAIARAVAIPCQLGGGLRTETALETVLEKVGLDRAIVGTQALKQPDWFREMTARFPGASPWVWMPAIPKWPPAVGWKSRKPRPSTWPALMPA